jgi:hypothetical protein
MALERFSFSQELHIYQSLQPKPVRTLVPRRCAPQLRKHVNH